MKRAEWDAHAGDSCDTCQGRRFQRKPLGEGDRYKLVPVKVCKSLLFELAQRGSGQPV